MQGSIQDIRLAAYYAGILKSNKQQKVEVKDDVVRIISTDRKKVSIPQYVPAALLTALDKVDEAEDAADEAAAASVDTSPAARAPASPAAAPPPQAPPPAAPVPGSAGYVAPAAAQMTPPTIIYGEPENTFWESAVTFAGGAVIGVGGELVRDAGKSAASFSRRSTAKAARACSICLARARSRPDRGRPGGGTTERRDAAPAGGAKHGADAGERRSDEHRHGTARLAHAGALGQGAVGLDV